MLKLLLYQVLMVLSAETIVCNKTSCREIKRCGSNSETESVSTITTTEPAITTKFSTTCNTIRVTFNEIAKTNDLKDWRLLEGEFKRVATHFQRCDKLDCSKLYLYKHTTNSNWHFGSNLFSNDWQNIFFSDIKPKHGNNNCPPKSGYKYYKSDAVDENWYLENLKIEYIN